MFHGYGADAYDLLPLHRVYTSPPKPTWFFPTGPLKIQLAPGFEGHAWFPVDIQALQQVIHEGRPEKIIEAFPPDLSESRLFAEQLIAELNIPLSKLILGGFSQGAMLATELVLQAPVNSAGLVILSGSLIHEKTWRKVAPLRAGMPFFQSHGEHDPLLPLSHAKKLEALLLQSGLKGHLRVFSGGHEIPPSILVQLREFFTTYLTYK